jgi:hypothetical protein
MCSLEEFQVIALLRDVIARVADEDAQPALAAASSAPATMSAKNGLAILMTVMPSRPLRPARSCCAAWRGT